MIFLGNFKKFGLLLFCVAFMSLSDSYADEIMGRYIILHRDSSVQGLGAKEIEIFSGGENISSGIVPSVTSSEEGTEPSAVTDDDLATEWVSLNDAEQELTIDLGVEKSLDKVWIYLRDEHLDELNGALFQISNESGVVVYDKEINNTDNSKILAFNFNLDLAPISMKDRLSELSSVLNAPAPYINGGFDKAYSMPFGSGLVSSMIAYEDNVEIHLSKTDFFAIDAENEGDWKSKYHSPGHISIDFGISRDDILSFKQTLDYNVGGVTMQISTNDGDVNLTAYGYMGKSALIFEVNDSRANREASLNFNIWRPLDDELDPITLDSKENIAQIKEVHKYIAASNSYNDDRLAPQGTPPETDKYYNLGVCTEIAFADMNGIIDSDVSVDGQNITVVPSALPDKYWVIVACSTSYDGQPEQGTDEVLSSVLDFNKLLLLPGNEAWWHDYWNHTYIDLQGTNSDKPLKAWYNTMYTYAIMDNPLLPPNFNGNGLLLVDDRFSWGSSLYWQNNRILMWMLGPAGLHKSFKCFLNTYDHYFNQAKTQASYMNKLGVRLLEAQQMYKPTLISEAKNLSPFSVSSFNAAANDHSWEDNSNTLNASERSFQQIGELVQQMFDYVAFSGDEEFKERVAIPWLKEAALFYLTTIRADDDGVYHMMKSDAVETYKVLKDPVTDIMAMNYLFTMILQYGDEFGYEQSFLDIVSDRMEHLAPVPEGRWNVDSNIGNAPIDIDWDANQFGVANAEPVYPSEVKSYNAENPELYTVMPFAYADAQSDDELFTKALNTFNNRNYIEPYGWDQGTLDAARLHLPQTFDLIVNHDNIFANFPYGGFSNMTEYMHEKSRINKLSICPQMDSACMSADALQEMLLQSHSTIADIGKYKLGTGPLQIIPAVNDDFAGRFKLYARGGFCVECSFLKEQKVSALKITSLNGNKLVLNNPFADCKILKNGEVLTDSLSDGVVNLITQKGDVFEFLDNEKNNSLALSGKVLGDVVAGVDISLSGIVNYSITTADDGTFEFSNLPEGAYILKPYKSGYSFSPASRTVTLSGGELQDIDFTASENIGKFFHLTVNDGSGSGLYVEGETIEISAGRSDKALFNKWTGDVEFLDSVDSVDAVVTMPAQDVELTALFYNPPLIAGKVINSTNQEGLEGLTIKLHSDDGDLSSITSDTGGFLFADLVPGVYTISAESDTYNFWPSSTQLTIGEDDSQIFDFIAYSKTDNKDDFVTVWDTRISDGDSSATIEFPIYSGSFDIDWDNDGVYDDIGVSNAITHTYPKPGIYVVSVSSAAPELYFGGSDYSKKILSILQWGTGKWGPMDVAFENCKNLVLDALDTPDLSDCTTCEYMFDNADKISNGNGNWNWDISHIDNLKAMFIRCSEFNADLSSWDTSNVSSMDYMFSGCPEFNADISSWDTSNVYSMVGMFSGCSAFNRDISTWNVANVDDFSYMFEDAISFNSPLNTWDTSNASDMSYMFSNAESFNQDISSWDVSSIGDMSGMFENAFAFNQDISSWDTSNLSNTSYMFASTLGDMAFDCNLGSWNISSLSDAEGMFSGHKLSQENYNALLLGWSTQSVIDSVIFDAGLSTYTAGGEVEDARNELLRHKWTISDGGGIERHTLTVNGGTGSGTYIVKETVTIVAQSPSGQAFDKWSGDIDFITDSTQSLISFPMPNKDIEITAEFVTPEDYYKSISGTVSGYKKQGVVIGLNGIDFTVSDENGDYFFNNVKNGVYTVTASSPGTVCSPDSIDVAVYSKDITGIDFTTTQTFKLEITRGSGSGNYLPGDSVQITAISSDADFVFSHWTGDIENVEDINKSITNVVMPSKDIKIEANFKQVESGTYTISGTISGGVKRAVLISVDNSFLTKTDSYGEYSIGGLESGHHTVKASFDGYSFTPDVKDILIEDVDVENVDFEAKANPVEPGTKFYLKVANGTGSGYYEPGTAVSVEANKEPGKMSYWSGDTDYMADQYSTKSVFFMPSHDCEITADLYNVSLYGDIYTQDYTIPEGMTIQAKSGDNTYTTTVNSYGYMFDTLPPGDYTVEPVLNDDTIGAQKYVVTIGNEALDSLDFYLYDKSNADSDAFVILATTDSDESSDDRTFSFNVEGTCQIDWDNDGVYDETVSDVTVTHEYDTAGLYTINIKSDSLKVDFSDSETSQKILDILQWGSIKWTSMNNSFSGCYNLIMEAQDIPDLSACTDCSSMFSSAMILGLADGNWNWNTSNVQNMNSMFDFCLDFNKDISSWDTSNVTDMGYMFSWAFVFNQPIGTWDTSKVDNMENLFDYASKFNQDISNWNTGNVVDFSWMFFHSKTFNQPLNTWNMSNAGQLYSMFEGAYEFNQPLNDWDVSNVLDCSSMFKDAYSFNQDLNQWDIGNVEDLSSMFENAVSFNSNIGDWNTSNVTSFAAMFKYAQKFNQEINDWDTSKVTDLSYMFAHALSMQEDISYWNVESVITAEKMFEGVTYDIYVYSSLLQDWSKENLQRNVVFDGGNSKYYYTVAESRQKMIDDYSWTITDAGEKQQFSLLVHDGSYTGYVFLNEKILVVADTIEGATFVNWTGDVEYLSDPNAEATVLTMPAKDVTLQANFEFSAEHTFSISGRIRGDIDGEVTIKVDDEHYTVIDGSGSYKIDNLKQGEYTVVVSADNYILEPESQTVIIKYYDIEDVDFDAERDPDGNKAPEPQDDYYSVVKGDTLNVSAVDGVLQNDYDPDDDKLIVDTEDSDSIFNEDGSFTFDSSEYDYGTQTFYYEVTDGEFSEYAECTIEVKAKQMIALDDNYSILYGNTLNVDEEHGVLVNDTIHDGFYNNVEVVQEPKHGSLDIYYDGSFSYTPNKGFAGKDFFTYQVTNYASTSNISTVTINVEPKCITLGSLLHYDPATTELPEFVKSPKVYGLIDGGKKASLKSDKNVSPPSVGAIWSKKISLYNKKELKSTGYKNYFDSHGPLTPKKISIYLRGKKSNKEKFDTHIQDVFLVPPVITAIKSDGVNDLISVSPGEPIFLEGKFFGNIKPKVYLEVNGKLLKCSILSDPSFYLDYKGKNAPMDIETGNSHKTIILPVKNLSPGNYPLIYDNKIGIATMPSTNGGKAALPMITIK